VFAVPGCTLRAEVALDDLLVGPNAIDSPRIDTIPRMKRVEERVEIAMLNVLYL